MSKWNPSESPNRQLLPLDQARRSSHGGDKRNVKARFWFRKYVLFIAAVLFVSIFARSSHKKASRMTLPDLVVRSKLPGDDPFAKPSSLKTNTTLSQSITRTRNSSDELVEVIKQLNESSTVVIEANVKNTAAAKETPPKNESASEDKAEVARYDIDQLSYGKPETFEEIDEVFKCDRSHWRTDVCTVKGDVRVDASRNLVMLYAKNEETARGVETVKAYTRKWEKELMSGVHDIVIKSITAPEDLDPWIPATEDERKAQMEKDGVVEDLSRIGKETTMVQKYDQDKTYELGNGTNWSDEVWKIKRTQRLPEHVSQLWFYEEERESVGKLLLQKGGTLEHEGRHAWVVFNGTKYTTKQEMEGKDSPVLKCDVRHSVPGVVFSTSGYTGNVYHEFNDGLIPLYITAHRFFGDFVPIVEAVELWWLMKYENILRKLSNYPVVLLGKERSVHCFSEVIVGLRIHDELTVYPQMLPAGNGSIQDFQSKLQEGWKDYPYFEPHAEGNKYGCRPLMTLISRQSTRVIVNEGDVISLAVEMGFFVRVVSTEKHVPLATVWDNLQQSNLMVGVHGAAMTHFILMRPGSCYIQILPLGTDWPAKTYYGDPAIRLGLQYTGYKVDINESSLSAQYPKNHTVLVDPQTFFHQVGWWTAKEIYLEKQNVTLDLGKLRKVLERVKQQLQSDPLYIKHAKKRESKRCQRPDVMEDVVHRIVIPVT